MLRRGFALVLPGINPGGAAGASAAAPDDVAQDNGVMHLLAARLLSLVVPILPGLDPRPRQATNGK